MPPENPLPKLNSWLIFSLLLLSLVAIGLAQAINSAPPRPAPLARNPAAPATTRQITVLVGGTAFQTEVADTPESRAQGLSGRDTLAPQAAMLFVFPEPTRSPFWMKDMNFPLDILWLDDQRQIIGLVENLAPDSYPNVVLPPAPVKYVLEINAGLAAKHGLKTGLSARW